MKKINLPVIVLKGIILLPNNDIRLEFQDNETKNNVIFNIDVPYLIKKGRKEYASMEVFLEGFEKNQYNYKQISFENMFDNEELEEE